MRIIALSAGLAFSIMAGSAFADEPSTTGQAASPTSQPEQAATYSTSTTTMGVLLANPATKAILLKYIPNIVNNPQIDQASSMTLKAIQPYAADQLTDTVLAQIDADLAMVPVSK